MIRFVLSRLTPYPSFYKFLGLHVLGVLAVAYIASRFTLSVQGSTLPVGQLFKYPDVWQTLTALSRWLFFVPAFFTVQLVCAELELKVVRSHVINGLGRGQIAGAWTVQNLLLTLVGLVATVCAAVLYGSGSPVVGDAARVELGFVLYGWAFLNWAVLCATLLRRPVPSLVLLLLGPLVLEPLVSMTLRNYNMEAVASYLPFASLSALVPWPGGDLPGVGALVLGTLWGALASLLAWGRLELTDL